MEIFQAHLRSKAELSDRPPFFALLCWFFSAHRRHHSPPLSCKGIDLVSLSVCIITKNEAHNIAQCLQSVRFADQLVVLDSGSTDGTADIARSFGAEVRVSDDWQGFGVQKNRALAAATQAWVLSLDADEVVSAELQAEILGQLAQCEFTRQAIPGSPAAQVAFEIPRLTQFCGSWIRHCGWTPDYVLRLFRRGDAEFSTDLVHESVRLLHPKTRVIRLKHPLLHYSYPSPDQYWIKLQRYSRDWAVQRHARGQTTSIWRAGAAGLVAFFRSYVFRLGFLDGAMGFAVCTMQAQSAFGKYFELYCLGRKIEK